MSQPSPLILVDGSSYLFRAFYALPDLRTARGQPTGAIRGVISMLRKLQNDYPGSCVVAIFDAPGKTFRDQIFEEYKANRPSMPDDLRSQIEPLHDLIETMGFPLLVVPDVEADDVIGTLATQATKKGIDTIISTSDKDLAQLVNPHVTWMDTMKDEFLNRDGVVEKFGVPPERIIDYLALMGDKVDNIPGVDKCGPKTAVKWLNEYDSLDGVIENAESVGGKIGENLREAIPWLPRSYELATIKCDVELSFDLEDLSPNEVDGDLLKKKFEEFEFRTFLDQLGQGTSDEVESTEVEVSLISDTSSLTKLVEKLESSEQFAVHAFAGREVAGLGFAIEPTEAYYIPLNHEGLTDQAQLGKEECIRALTELMTGPKTKVFHDAKASRHACRRLGMEIKDPIHDVMLEAYVLHSSARGGLHLRALSAKYLDVDLIDLKELVGTGAKRISVNDVPMDSFADYAGEYVATCLRLHAYLADELAQENKLRNVYRYIELPLEPVLYQMECNGILFDPDVANDFGDVLDDRIKSLQGQAHEIAGKPFSLNSPKQLQEILFDDLKLTAPRANKRGHRSTSVDVLEDLALREENELPQIILDYRHAAKLRSTYIDNLLSQVDRSTHRIHTTYEQAHAITGRLASVNPNLQNIPIRTEEGRKIREAFIPPEGRVLVSADYSQIELRVMAHITKDEGLTKAFANRLDVHQATASEIYGVPLEEVTPNQRRDAKTINFGLMYGMSAFGLARSLGIPQHAARDTIDRYFDKYPAIQGYVEDTKKRASRDGYVETIFGRRIHLSDINARNPMQRQAAERLSINAPVQGSAADIIKRATVDVHEWLLETEPHALMLLQVHDELVFEVAEDEVDFLKEGVEERMLEATELDVELLVDFGVGSNWSETH